MLAVLREKDKENPLLSLPCPARPVSSPEDLRAAIQIRMAVFVEEQGVPREEEIDSYDPQAFHVLARSPEGQAVATGRLVTSGSSGKLGRIAVLRSRRGQGWGRSVMLALIEEAHRRGLRELVLDSQVQAIPFYRTLGFRPEGETFLDCGIPHQRMTRTLETSTRKDPL